MYLKNRIKVKILAGKTYIPLPPIRTIGAFNAGSVKIRTISDVNTGSWLPCQNVESNVRLWSYVSTYKFCPKWCEKNIILVEFSRERTKGL